MKKWTEKVVVQVVLRIEKYLLYISAGLPQKIGQSYNNTYLINNKE